MAEPLDGLPPPEPPPIGGELEAMLGKLEPVRTRRPLRDLAKVAAVSLVYGAVMLLLVRMRREAWEVPLWWLVTIAIVWFAAFGAMLAIALVPRRGAVVPRWRVAGFGAAIVAGGFVVAGLMMHPMSLHSTVLDLPTLHRGHHCLEIGLVTAIVPALLGALALRGAMPVGSRWTAAALGAAGGSLGGLVLHLHCPIADRWHLGLVHGGVVVVSAALAAVFVPRLTTPR